MKIGVHTAGSNREDVESLVKELDLGYPICIDTTTEEGRDWGTLFTRFGVGQLPHTFVIDKTGKVVAHGELEETLSKAHGFAKQTVRLSRPESLGQPVDWLRIEVLLELLSCVGK